MSGCQKYPFFILNFAKKILTRLIILVSILSNSVADEIQRDVNKNNINNNIIIEITDSKLTLIAKQISVSTILGLINHHYPVIFGFSGKLQSDLQNWNIRDVPLDDALREILRQYSLVMHYQLSHMSDVQRLVKVDIISENGQSLDMVDLPVKDHAFTQVNKLQGLNDPITISQLSNSLREEESYQARIRAATLLEEIGTARAKEAVVDALGDDNSIVRARVIKLLEKRTDAQSTLLLGQAIHGDPDAQVRLAALQVLANRKDEIARVFINSALQDRDNRVVELAKQLTTNTGNM